MAQMFMQWLLGRFTLAYVPVTFSCPGVHQLNSTQFLAHVAWVDNVVVVMLLPDFLQGLLLLRRQQVRHHSYSP